jgi:acyl carrier protein
MYSSECLSYNFCNGFGVFHLLNEMRGVLDWRQPRFNVQESCKTKKTMVPTPNALDDKNITANEEIEKKLRKFIAENLLFSEQEYPFDDDESFLQRGVVDSLGVMELVSFVGQEFGVPVEPVEVTPENFDSVGRLAAYVRQKLQLAPGGACVGS